MLDAEVKQAIRHALWRCFDSVRGVADVGEVRDHLLALLVLKYAFDHAVETSHAVALYADTESVPSFEQLLNAKHMPDIGQHSDRALAHLEKQHPLLQDAFHSVRFDSSLLGDPKQRQHVIADLLSCFGRPEFDFQGGASAEAAGFACETLISEAAVVAGKRGAEFFTPPEVSRLIAAILRPEAGESVGDPCCGSGTLLLTCSAFARAQSSGGEGCQLFGQEKNGSTWALAKINMFLHGERATQLAWGDTLKDPRLVAGGQLQKFDVAVSNPPFNVKDWGQEAAVADPFCRYRRGVPPRAFADYAFISHMVETLKPGRGRMAVVVSHGVLFRSGAELQIRRQLLEEGLVDAVVALPAKLLPNTPLPIALLVLRKDKSDGQVLFVDASRQFEHGKTQNQLREEDLAQIETTYVARADVEGYARLVSLEDILQNDCNLNVVRYVDAVEQVCKVDLEALRAERAQLRAELEGLESQFASLMEEVSRA